MLKLLLLMSFFWLQDATQQSIPSAPEPKSTPGQIKFPPRPLVEASPPAANAGETTQEFGVSREILDGPQGYIIKDFLKHRLQPTINQRWNDYMPEEAKDHRKWGIGKKGKSGTVRVSFNLHKDGKITDVALADSSGDKLLDEAALKAVKASQPLPLPSAFAKDVLNIKASFYYNPPKR